MSLAQGHNAVTLVILKPAGPRSWVKHTTTEPLCSLYWFWWDEVENYFIIETEIMDIVYVLDKQYCNSS